MGETHPRRRPSCPCSPCPAEAGKSGTPTCGCPRAFLSKVEGEGQNFPPLSRSLFPYSPIRLDDGDVVVVRLRVVARVRPDLLDLVGLVRGLAAHVKVVLAHLQHDLLLGEPVGRGNPAEEWGK